MSSYLQRLTNSARGSLLRGALTTSLPHVSEKQTPLTPVQERVKQRLLTLAEQNQNLFDQIGLTLPPSTLAGMVDSFISGYSDEQLTEILNTAVDDILWILNGTE